jgi:hypothetical protein
MRAARVAAAALAVLLSSLVAAAEDPYAAWGHGRPQDALVALHATAEASRRWDAWLDLGLAAAAADRRGEAVVWVLAAYQADPSRPEPRQALRALEVTVPPGWLDRLGPLARPGIGWLGVALLAVGGALVGYAAVARTRRLPLAGCGGLLLLLALPGQAAWQLDHQRRLVATARDSQLYDSAGTPVAAVAAGTILARESDDEWAGRILVQHADGRRGHLPSTDTTARP